MYLKDGGVFVAPEVLLPGVFPRDAEHGLVLVVPHQTRVPPAGHLPPNIRPQTALKPLSLLPDRLKPPLSLLPDRLKTSEPPPRPP